MSNHTAPKKDNKGIGGAIVGGVGQVVDAYNLGPVNQGTTTNSTNPPTPPPAGEPSVEPGNSPDSQSANTSSEFRPKGRITASVKGAKPPGK